MSEEAKDTTSATWKFDFENTVNADPLAKGSCLKVARAYLDFASQAKPDAFCSLPELMLRTGSSKPAVLRAKTLLERLGYLVPLFVTEEGATMYRLVNARKQMIDDHLRIAREAFAAEKRFRKRRERQKTKQGSNETIPPENDNWERNDTPVGNETIPNTVEEYRRDYLYETGAHFEEVEGPETYSSEDLTTPFDIPGSEEEAEAFIASLGDFPPIIARQLKKMALGGELTPLFMTSDLCRRHA
jgi:hypothetical protein